MPDLSAVIRGLVEVTAISALAAGDRRATPRFPPYTDADFLKFAYGTAASQIQLMYTGQRTLTATSEELDLRGGLTDYTGAALTFGKVNLIAVKNRNTTAAKVLTMGHAAANAFLGPLGGATYTTTIDGASGWHMYVNPSGWTASAALRYLKFDSGADTIIYDLMILGS